MIFKNNTIVKYLQNKIKGGFVNHRGNTYENYFATFKVAEMFNLFPLKLSDIIISSQENNFVDDLFILNESDRHLFQLKTSKKLNWGKKFKTLGFDFRIQQIIEKYYKRTFTLNLVVSQEQLKNELTTSLPSTLINCTNIVYFPQYDSISKQIINDPNFKKELVKLCAITPENDKLEALASCILGACILGAWSASNQKKVVMSDLLLAIKSINYSFIKREVTNNLSNTTIKILSSIDNFSYNIESGYFVWEFMGTDKGIIPYTIDSEDFLKVEREIINSTPKDFYELEHIIS